jgi:hypothetical protein
MLHMRVVSARGACVVCGTRYAVSQGCWWTSCFSCVGIWAILLYSHAISCIYLTTAVLRLLACWTLLAAPCVVQAALGLVCPYICLTCT